MRNNNYYIPQIDTSIEYIVPLIPMTNHRRDRTEKPVNLYVTQNAKTGVVSIKKEGFIPKYIDGLYFSYLLDVGYIKKG